MSTTAPSAEPAVTTFTSPLPGLTVRSISAGLVFAVVMCAMNSYLTLSFGVIEEGPTIAALFFFAVFFLSRTKITTTEMVIVATMGSAGGSFGFIANFYAAKAMTGAPYTIGQMIGFGIVSSLVGLTMVIPLRELLIRKTQLPWPGSRATESVIRALVEHGDPRQPIYLLITFALATFYIVANNDGGVGWVPAEVTLPFGLAAVGGAIALSPFATAGSYLMGMRTCVGFLVGATALMIMAPHLPLPGWQGGASLARVEALSFMGHVPAKLAETPHRYVWPGLGFLTASGLTLIAVNWRVMADSFRSLLTFRGKEEDPAERVLPPRLFALLFALACIAAVVVLTLAFHVPVGLVLILIAIGGLLQNIIATRAQAQTAFNPARVMGILLEGVCALFGGRATAVNLTGAGFVAGSGAQAGNLTGDMAYGRRFGVPPRWQFLVQAATVLPCAIIAAFVFQWIIAQKPITPDHSALSAPVATMWADMSKLFAGNQPLAAAQRDALLIGAAIGVVYTLIEQIKRLHRFVPCSVGLGLGLVLSPSNGLAFFLGGFVMWIVLARWAKVRDVTLTTIAVGAIVGEGIGGVLQALIAQLRG